MSHETHETHSTENKSATPFRSAIWLTIILAGLFVAAVNFVEIMGNEEGEEHTEQVTTEHKSAENAKEESGMNKAEHSEATPVIDSTHNEGH